MWLCILIINSARWGFARFDSSLFTYPFYAICWCIRRRVFFWERDLLIINFCCDKRIIHLPYAAQLQPLLDSVRIRLIIFSLHLVKVRRHTKLWRASNCFTQEWLIDWLPLSRSTWYWYNSSLHDMNAYVLSYTHQETYLRELINIYTGILKRM